MSVFNAWAPITPRTESIGTRLLVPYLTATSGPAVPTRSAGSEGSIGWRRDRFDVPDPRGARIPPCSRAAHAPRGHRGPRLRRLLRLRDGDGRHRGPDAGGDVRGPHPRLRCRPARPGPGLVACGGLAADPHGAVERAPAAGRLVAARVRSHTGRARGGRRGGREHRGGRVGARTA